MSVLKKGNVQQVGKEGQFYKVVNWNYMAFYGNDPFSYKGSVGWTLYEDTPGKAMCKPGMLHAWANLSIAVGFARQGSYHNKARLSYHNKARLFIVEGVPVRRQHNKFGFHEYTVIKECKAKDRAALIAELAGDLYYGNTAYYIDHTFILD